MSEVLCPGCFHHCLIPEGKNGLCRARGTRSGKNVCVNYGRITSLAMDPIEKKPLKHFYPGSWILSAGSYGCNLSCPFCQNSMISMADEFSVSYRAISPEELAEIALREEDNLGIAFTYNEPMISWEYLIDTAALLRPHGKKIVLVTNGCVSDDVLDLLLPYVDAMNIDLKGDAVFYQELGGSDEMVRHTIERCGNSHNFFHMDEAWKANYSEIRKGLQNHNMKKFQAKLQTFAGAMMVPIILLVLVGFFVGIGAAFTNYILPEGTFLYKIFSMLTNLGFMFMNNLGLWYAVALSFTLAKKEKGWAAFAGLIMFYCYMRGIEG